MIQWKRQPQEVTILLCAMLGIYYDSYKGMKDSPDARRIYRAYKQGLKAMKPEIRFYFDPLAVMPRDYPDDARREADRIFYANF